MSSNGQGEESNDMESEGEEEDSVEVRAEYEDFEEEEEDDVRDTEESAETDEEDSETTQKADDNEFVTRIPVDWSPPDDSQQAGYNIALRQVAEEVAGQLGSKFPVLVGPHRPKRRPDVPTWLPVSLLKKSAPASAFLTDLISRGDIIFREINKNNVSRKANIIER